MWLFSDAVGADTRGSYEPLCLLQVAGHSSTECLLAVAAITFGRAPQLQHLTGSVNGFHLASVPDIAYRNGKITLAANP
jgi:hypothetical protein